MDTDPSLVHDRLWWEALNVDPISVEVGDALVELTDPEKRNLVLPAVGQLCEDMAEAWGISTPTIRVRPHLGLGPLGYHLRIHDELIAAEEIDVESGSDADIVSALCFGIRGHLETRLPSLLTREGVAALLGDDGGWFNLPELIEGPPRLTPLLGELRNTLVAGSPIRELDARPSLKDKAAGDPLRRDKLRFSIPLEADAPAPLELLLGRELTGTLDAMEERLSHVRRRVGLGFGVLMPPVSIVDDALPGSDYSVGHGSTVVATGTVMPGYLLGIGQNLAVSGVDVIQAEDPIYKTPAVWVPTGSEVDASATGLQLFDIADVICTHVAESAKERLPSFLTPTAVAQYLATASEFAPITVAEVVYRDLHRQVLGDVLRSVVASGVSVRSSTVLLGALVDAAEYTDDARVIASVVCVLLQRDDGAEARSTPPAPPAPPS